MKTLIAIIMLLLLGVISCRKKCPCTDPTNPECENYDPCYGKKPVTADFEMSHTFSFKLPEEIGQWHPDVAFFRSSIGFNAIGYDTNNSTVKYTWILGSETIEGGYFARNFSNTSEDNIPVTLIIQKQPDKKCFPNDDGRDTLVRYIKFYERTCERLTTGDFKVLFKGEKDSVIIRIRNWETDGGSLDLGYKVIDTCTNNRKVFLIGFDRKKPQPDTTNWSVDPYQFYSSLYIMNNNDVNPYTYGNHIRVDPKTWIITGEYGYQYDATGMEFKRKYKFNGRKIR